MFLTRQTRAAASEFGLPPRDVRSLSAATYEVGRHLVERSGIQAGVRLADGPSLQVVFQVPLAAGEERARLRTRVLRLVRPLRPLVHDIQVEAQDARLSVCLRSLLPGGSANSQPEAASGYTPALERLEEIPSDDLRQRYVELMHASRALQTELQETNRGVIALYAELEAHAARLKEAEDRLRLLLDSVQDYAICMLTPNGVVASWNAGAERLFGYGADEIIGRSFEAFFARVERQLGVPAEHLRTAEGLGRLACESVRLRKEDIPFDAHVLLTPVRRGRELRGFSLVVRDITQRKQLEGDLRRRAEDLAAANRAKEEFLATLSHELRTPLNAMLGWTRLLRMGKLDGPAKERALETIERNARIQEQLIADLLEVSRIVTGKLRLELRPIELTPIVLAAMDAVRPAADAKGVLLTGAPAFNGTVLGDPDRLQQVAWNLLVNAIKFTPAGGEVTVALTQLEANAVITVSDTGEGISPELLPFVFDRFTQGDSTMTRPHGGLGLGLSIVRHIVELHGGKVVAHSGGLGSGATFSIHLPVRVNEEGPGGSCVSRPQPTIDAAAEESQEIASSSDRARRSRSRASSS